MSNAFGVVTAWIVLLGGLALVGQGFWRAVKAKRLCATSVATAALGFALAVQVAPSIFYPELRPAELNPFFWTSVTLVAIALIFAITARRSVRTS
jgi:hypothetical protein